MDGVKDFWHNINPFSSTEKVSPEFAYIEEKYNSFDYTPEFKAHQEKKYQEYPARVQEYKACLGHKEKSRCDI